MMSLADQTHTHAHTYTRGNTDKLFIMELKTLFFPHFIDKKMK